MFFQKIRNEKFPSRDVDTHARALELNMKMQRQRRLAATSIAMELVNDVENALDLEENKKKSV